MRSRCSPRRCARGRTARRHRRVADGPPPRERLTYGGRATADARSTTCSSSAASRPASELVPDVAARRRGPESRRRPASAPAAEHAGVQRRGDAARRGRLRRRRPAQLESALANLIDNAVKYSDAGGVGRGAPPTSTARSALRGRRPRHRHPGPRTWSGLRALLPRRPGPQPATPVAPAWAWPSCATSRRTTAAPSSVESTEGRGFRPSRSRLPRRPGSTPTEAVATLQPSRSERPFRPSEPSETSTVLVVEDEESFVDALTVGLAREGFRVEVARDGAEALDRFDDVDPDLVLLDVMLPQGLRASTSAASCAAASTVPIIMVTAKAAEIDTVVGLEVGADDYVTKPYRLRELVARMRAVLRRRQARGRGRRPERSPRTRSCDRRRGPRPPTPRGPRPRRAGASSRSRSSSCWRCCWRTPAGCCPRHADRPGLGQRLRRRHQDPRRARQAAALEDRGRSRRTPPGSSPSAGSATSYEVPTLLTGGSDGSGDTRS